MYEVKNVESKSMISEIGKAALPISLGASSWNSNVLNRLYNGT